MRTRLGDFATDAKGLRGTLSFTQVEKGGTLALTGSYAQDLEFSHGLSAGLKLVAHAQSLVPVNIRAVGTDVYFQSGNTSWAHLLANDPRQTAAQTSQLNLSALLLSGLSPFRYENLVNSATRLTAEPPTTVAGAQVYGFTGTAGLFESATTIQQYSELATVGLDNAGVKAVSFEVLLNRQGQLVRATQHFVGSDGFRIDYRLDVTGYSAPPVTAPITG